MIKNLLLLLGMLVSSISFAADIAACSNPSGKAYYPYLGLVPKVKSGWVDDGIKGGLTKITVNEQGKYDVLFLDTQKEVISATSDGATVLLFAKGEKSFGILVLYPKGVVETYTFLRNEAGVLEYLHTTAKAGDEVTIVKSSLFKGTCNYINFNQVK